MIARTKKTEAPRSQKPSGRAYSARLRGPRDAAAELASPLSPPIPFLQRKCACGGSCPACKTQEGPPKAQPKLEIGAPGDRYEREADDVAARVMRMPDPGAVAAVPTGRATASNIIQPKAIAHGGISVVQRQAEPGGEELQEEDDRPVVQGKVQADAAEPTVRRQETADEDEDTVQTKPEASAPPALIQRQVDSDDVEDEEIPQRKQLSQTPAPLGSVRSSIQRLRRDGGAPLSASLRGFMEPRFGYDFSRVRIHNGGVAQRSARALRAKAYTVGHDVVFGAGQYAPKTPDGRRLLAHELTHVVQQKGASRATGPPLGPALADAPRGDQPSPASDNEAHRPGTHGSAAKGAGEGGGDADIDGLSDALLTSGGQPMPGEIRNDFEPRFGVDFGAVRIHAGAKAAELNDALDASAFTYGSHIWLGRGEPVARTETLAHELAHTVQQTGPRPLLPDAPAPASSAGKRIQRKLYWEPADWSGTKTHKEVLGVISKANKGNIFIEAPIPNATKKGVGKEIGFGYADLMKVSGHGKRALGVRFDNAGQALPLPAPVKTRNPGYIHSRKSAPLGHSDHTITNISMGATSIKIADLKPAPANPSGNRGKTQIENYLGGIKHARDLSNAWANLNGKSGWDLKDTGLSHWTGIDAPEKPRGKKFQNQPLVVKEFTWVLKDNNKNEQNWRAARRVFDPKKDGTGEVRGHLRLEKVKHGIVQYRWVPSFNYSPQRLTAAVSGFDKKHLDPLLRDLRTLKVKKVQGRFRPGPVRPRLSRIGRILRRKPKPDTKVKDEFRAADWEKKRGALIRAYSPVRKQASVADRRTVRFLVDADKDIDSRDGFATKTAVVGDIKNIKLIKKIDLWSGAKVKILGRLRQTFGGAFVAVANLVHSMRSKLQNLLEKKRSKPSPNSYGAVAILAIWRAAVAIARPLFRQTMAVLSNSLRMGVKTRLKGVLPFDNPDQLGEAIAGEFPAINALKTRIDEVKTTIDGEVKGFLATFGKEMDQLKKLSDTARTVGHIIKAAMVVVQCASPPIVGCLKLLASTLIARAANAIMKWCPIHEKFQKMALKVEFLRTLPKTLANGFVNAMPEDVQAFFDRSVLEKLPLASEVKEKCDNRGQKALTERQKALVQLMTDMGCEEDLESDGCQKLKALAELMEKRGLRDNVMKLEDIRKLAPLLKNKKFTAKDLRNVARFGGGKSKPATVLEFLEKLPQEVERGRSKQRFWQALSKFPKKIKGPKGLKKGTLLLDTGALTPDAMASGSIPGVAIFGHLSGGQVVAGHVDVEFIGPFNCVSRRRIVVRIKLQNVALSDSKGNSDDFGLENSESELSHTRSAKRMASFRKKLCP